MTEEGKIPYEPFTDAELFNLEHGFKRDHPNLNHLKSFKNMFKKNKMKRVVETGTNVLHENGGHIDMHWKLFDFCFKCKSD